MLGKKVRDKVTGLVGIAISRLEFMNGCIQFCVKPPVDKEGKIREGEYIDHQQLEIIEDAVEPKMSKTGGIMPDTPGDIYKG